MTGLLEVTVLHPRDVAGAQEGGADRLFLTRGGPVGGLSPEPGAVAAVVRESDVPVRVMLRLSDSPTTNGGEFTRLVGLAQDYAAIGAEGVAFGFLDGDLEVDIETCTALAEEIEGVPWTFHRVFDDALDARRSWRRVAGLPGLDSVRSAGSPRGLSVGYDELVSRAESDPEVARLLMPGGGLTAEMVPWFRRAGVTAYHLGPQVRPGGSDKAYVDARHVRSWRLLLDRSS
ncbi:MAG TPA: copper homeostasis protein CutC [Nocardioides sp.]|jgi:copper homeostasis protein